MDANSAEIGANIVTETLFVYCIANLYCHDISCIAIIMATLIDRNVQDVCLCVSMYCTLLITHFSVCLETLICNYLPVCTQLIIFC